MPKEQLNFRVSDLTRRQLDELSGQWGTTQTETLTVIIDRIYQQEIAMAAKIYSRRQHIVEKVAERIHAAQWNSEQITAANNYGFTFDIRFQDGEYIGDSWSEVSNIHLEPAELDEAKRIAASF